MLIYLVCKILPKKVKIGNIRKSCYRRMHSNNLIQSIGNSNLAGSVFANLLLLLAIFLWFALCSSVHYLAQIFFPFYMTFNSTMGGGNFGEVTHIVTCTPYATSTFWKALYLMILPLVQWHHICNLCLFSFSICRDFLSYMICRTLNKDWKVISPVISWLTQGSLFQCYYFFFKYSMSSQCAFCR